MGRFFDLDNGFFRFMNKVFDMLVLNFFTVLLCVPIVTAGPAIASMYYITMKEVKNEEGYVVRPYFKFFKNNFKQGFILELIVAAAAVIMTADLYIMYQWVQKDSSFLLMALFAFLVGFSVLVAITAVFVFPMLAKFDNSIKGILTNSLMMAFRHLPQAVSVVIIVVLCGVLIYINPLTLFFTFGLCAYLTSMIIVKIFDRYIPKKRETADEDFHIEAIETEPEATEE